MNKKIVHYFVFIFVVVVFSATPLFAQENLIGCDPQIGGKAIIDQCNLCALAATFQNIVNFIFVASIPIGVIFILIGGAYIMMSGASPEWYKKGIGIFKAAFFVLILVLGSWMILNTFLSLVVGDAKDFQSFIGGWKDLSQLCGK